MTAPVVAVTRLIDGRSLTLPHITDLAITSALSSPAASLSFTAAVEGFPGELGAVTVRQDEKLLFTGQVDQQVSALSGQGRTLTVDARTKGALLLDNEALPCTLTNVGLATVFSLFIAPYGFLLNNPGPGRSLALYTVHKGLSEWEALTGYTLRVYGRTPYVAGDQVIVDAPRSASPLVIGGGGLPYTRLELAHIPYNLVSKVVLRDMDGNYTSAVHNSAADYYGARRKRYVIPANEFMDNLSLDANQRIRRSMLEMQRITVTLPGTPDIPLGQAALLRDDALTASNLLVREVSLRLSPAGLTTTLTLCSSLYYD